MNVYISAWASTLLVQLCRAMRRPQNVERVTGRIPRFLFYADVKNNNCDGLGFAIGLIYDVWQKLTKAGGTKGKLKLENSCLKLLLRKNGV